MQIDIVLNGRTQSAPEGQPLPGLLGQLQLDPTRVAVELDRRLIKPPLWAKTVLRHGAQLKIVQFVGGGYGPGVPGPACPTLAPKQSFGWRTLRYHARRIPCIAS